jgi:diacylglycerol kinase family enzyme
MDAVRVEIMETGRECFFFGSLSVGLGSTINRFVEDFAQRYPRIGRTRILGQILPGALGAILSFRKNMVPLEAWLTDPTGSKKIRFSLLVFLNTPFYGNGINLLPDASPFDGSLHVGILETKTFRETLRFAYEVFRGRHQSSTRFISGSSRTFRVKPLEPMDLQLDGDIFPQISEFELTVLPGALRVFI